jgi:hypothetical protein
MTITISIPSKEAQRILNGQGSGNSTEDERFQDAADTDTCNFFAVMSQYYKPEDFMLTVGILLAQGIARISDKKEQEIVLEEFVSRLKKHGGEDPIKLVQKFCEASKNWYVREEAN